MVPGVPFGHRNGVSHPQSYRIRESGIGFEGLHFLHIER